MSTVTVVPATSAAAQILPTPPPAAPQKLASAVTYAAADNPEFTAMIDERRCVDPQSGSLFAYTVEVRSEGKAFMGCAVHNPAMPAP